MNCDILAVGAHPDDIDFYCGGTLAKQAARGRRIAIVDLTAGELGSRGNAEIRSREAFASAEVLGVSERLTLDLCDTQVEDNRENRCRLVGVIRQFRPTVLISHFWEDAHPDHIAAGRLVWSSAYVAGLAKFPAEGEPYRPHAILFFSTAIPFTPTFIVDVSEHHAIKMRAVGCFVSQLDDGDECNAAPATPLSDSDFIPALEARSRYFGNLIGCTFGEPFLVNRTLPMDDPLDHFVRFPLGYARTQSVTS